MYQPYQFPPQQYGMQMPQMTPQLSSMTQPTLSGRIVKSVEEIVPNEVPMNGSVALFPTADMTSIYVKGWNPDGTISTIRYTPVVDNEQQEPTITLADVMDQLNDIQDLLKPKPAPKRNTRAKKEAEDDGE